MVNLKIEQSGKEKEFHVEKGTNLFQFLRSEGYEITAPCGGNGFCGKCQVNVKGEGRVTSCIYLIEKDTEVSLPGEREAKILVAQSEHCLSLPLYPGNFDHLSYLPYGVAIDIGTTSMVFYLVNLMTGTTVETRSIINPQTKYGGDVITRINHCAQNEQGLAELQKEVVDAINSQLQHFEDFLQVTSNELVKMTVAGNTTMLHLLLGVNPVSIALAPYVPQFTEGKNMTGKELDLNCNPEAQIKILPSISAYVGADIVVGIASIYSGAEEKNCLFVDVGTNGEMALMTPEKIYCCATAAGPAFEGANISCGMGAVDGAISVYNKTELVTLGNEKPIGICGSGLIDIVAYLVSKGIVDQDGLMEEDFIVVSAEESGNNNPIVITPADIREVQLAKSAVLSGIKILLQEAELEFDQINKLYLAGGFGNYISQESAMRIGLIPPEMEGKIIPVGNTSGAGAMLALRSIGFDKNIQEVLNKAEYIELSTKDEFMMEFAMNMAFV